jgi:hypothetical protein
VGAIGSGGGGDIPTADIEKGVTAYGWGDHRQAGYLKGITEGMVTGALGYTPMDEAAWTKANIKATLGIADWALAASKPAYTTKEVVEDDNLYFTDARAVAALAGVTNALAGDIGANATAIGVLQGYFTDGVAKSAAKLQTARKLWGQLFNGEADVTGALTGVTDITASGTLTIGKIKIGDGVIEWDAANGGFKVTGGLWATDYLSSKGVNTGASGGGGGSSYQRLDTWDGYTSAKDGWVLSAKLGYGLKTTQDDILRQLADISGQGTNVTFTPSLTSGTQIGTITIDGEPVKMYAPSIPTTDIEKGVTAYGWGNHATMGYITASASITGNAASASLIKPTTGTGVASTWVSLTSYTKVWGEAFNVSSLGSDTGDIALYLRSGVYTKNSAELCVAIDGDFYAQAGSKKVLHEGNYTDYAYSKTTIDSKFSGLGTFAYKSSLAFADLTGKPTTIGGYGITDAYTKSQVDSALGGYLPLSGGTIDGSLQIGKATNTSFNNILLIRSGHGVRINNTDANAYVSFGNTDASGYLTAEKVLMLGDNGLFYSPNGSNYYDIIHSGNIGSQSVLSAEKLIDASGAELVTTSDSTLYVGGGTYTSRGTHILGSDVRLRYGASAAIGLLLNSSGNVGIGTTTDNGYKLDVNGTLHASGAATFRGHVSIVSDDWREFSVSRGTNNISSMGGIDGNGVYFAHTQNSVTTYMYLKSGKGLSVYGTLYSSVGVYSDGYVSAKGQNTSSDMRLKRVLEEVTLSVEDIAAAPAFRFAWKGGGGVDVGTSAQYWEKVLPDVVKRDDAGWLTMQYGNAAMVAVIALARRVKELEEKLKIKS